MTKETKEVQKKQKNQSSEKMYDVSKEFLVAVRNVFGKKPFIEVAGVIQLLNKNRLTEKEINSIINVLGNYPYDEVNQIFVMTQEHVKLVKENE